MSNKYENHIVATKNAIKRVDERMRAVERRMQNDDSLFIVGEWKSLMLVKRDLENMIHMYDDAQKLSYS